MQDELQRNEVQVDNTDYLEAIKTLKENSVDRSKYDALKADNKRLLEAVVNGQTVEQQVAKQEVDVQALRNKLFQDDNQTNLEYWTNVLALRNALIEKGEEDPFLPKGKNVVSTQNDVEAAERVAYVVQECIDYAEGDSMIFTNELQRHLVDTTPTRRR